MEYTLDNIIRSYINENGENDSKYFRFLSIAWAGIEELNMDVSGIVSVSELTIDPNTCRADLPEDYIQYKRIAFCVGGRMVEFGRDDRLCLTSDFDDCGNPEAIPVTPDPRDSMPETFIGLPLPFGYTANPNGGIFGLGGGNNKNGYYRIDKENSQILFASTVTSDVILEYLGSAKKKKGQFIVHPYCVEALKAFIDWRKIDKRMYMGAWQLAREEYYNQRRLAKARYNTFTLSEVYAALRKSFKQAPKY